MVLALYSGLYRGQKSPPEGVLNDPLLSNYSLGHELRGPFVYGSNW